MVRQEDSNISTRIPRKLKQQILECVAAHAYMNQSDFIRIAVREKLDREASRGHDELGKQNPITTPRRTKDDRTGKSC